MADTEVAEIFTEEGADAREQLRVALHESAVALQAATLQGEYDRSEKALARRIAALGFAEGAEQVFDLLPLVHVAWADGTIQANERVEIIRLLRIRGVPMGKAYETMLALLEKKPTEQYLEASLDVLREVVKRGDGTQGKTIVGLCILVAKAAGGFLGLRNPISSEEKDAIERIAERLGPNAMAEFQRRLG